ncbi:MAG: hypothetical protein WCH40_11995, partial [Verrucomicrobiales bacterium]
LTPAVKKTEMNDSAAAIAHTCVCSRLTGMPSIEARSGADAAARIAKRLADACNEDFVVSRAESP